MRETSASQGHVRGRKVEQICVSSSGWSAGFESANLLSPHPQLPPIFLYSTVIASLPMRLTTIGSALVAMVELPFVDSQISLPFNNAIVTGVGFDGQPLDLYMDTGSRGTHVIYKDWYEKVYGKSSCPPRLCYACTGHCDPYKMPKRIVKFVDGSQITTVLHEGVIDVGGHKLKTKFRLIIGFSSPRSTEKPVNFLGLAPADTYNPQTIPLELFNNKIVQQYAVSICISASGVPTFGGDLLLGQWQGRCAIQSQSTMTVPMKLSGGFKSLFATNLAGLGLVSSKRQASTKQLSEATVVYDTGTYLLSFPQELFDYLIKEMRQSVKNDSGRDPKIKKVGYRWVIDKAAYNFLPTLTFNVGSYSLSPLVIRIPPKKYAAKYDDEWYGLKITTNDGKPIILGRPFFTTYFSSFDMQRKLVKLARYSDRP